MYNSIDKLKIHGLLSEIKMKTTWPRREQIEENAASHAFTTKSKIKVPYRAYTLLHNPTVHCTISGAATLPDNAAEFETRGNMSPSRVREE